VTTKRIDRRKFVMGTLAGAAALSWSETNESAPATGRRWRYGVIGSGTRSRGEHLPILRDYFPEVEIVALCDVTPENLAQGLEICGGATRGYSDYRRMLNENPELDAVVVCVPNYLHADIAVLALERGQHVLTEKPMATHLADASRMIATAAKHKRILQVGFQMRQSNLYHRAADLIAQGAVGDVELVFASLFRGDWNPKGWQYPDPKTGKRINWRFLTFTSGGTLLEEGIHDLDIIHWLVGADPKRIQAQGGNNVYRDRETIDHAQILIEFSNEVRCSFTMSLFTPAVPQAAILRVFGSRAEMSYLEDEGKRYIVIQPYRGKAERVEAPYLKPEEKDIWKGSIGRGVEADAGVCTYREHRAFLHSIATGEAPLVGSKVGHDAIHISLAAERSLHTGHPVNWEEGAESL
jgi:predicted dehydrogenase